VGNNVGCRALVVEEQPDVRRLIAIKLSDAGFVVSLALTGREAWDKALAVKPALVILGTVDRPTDDALFARDVKERWGQQAPIVIQLSAIGTVAGIEAAFRSGVDDYLVTPFSPRNLIERIIVAFVRNGREAELPACVQAEHSDERQQPHTGPRQR